MSHGLEETKLMEALMSVNTFNSNSISMKDKLQEETLKNLQISEMLAISMVKSMQMKPKIDLQ